MRQGRKFDGFHRCKVTHILGIIRHAQPFLEQGHHAINTSLIASCADVQTIVGRSQAEAILAHLRIRFTNHDVALAEFRCAIYNGQLRLADALDKILQQRGRLLLGLLVAHHTDAGHRLLLLHQRDLRTQWRNHSAHHAQDYQFQVSFHGSLSLL